MSQPRTAVVLLQRVNKWAANSVLRERERERKEIQMNEKHLEETHSWLDQCSRA